MKQWNSKLTGLLLCALLGTGGMSGAGLSMTTPRDTVPVSSVEERYENRVAQYRNAFTHLAPTHAILQMYGDIGLASAGVGWSYGSKRQWETGVMLGFIPKYSSTSAKLTATLKQDVSLWRIDVTGNLVYRPIRLGAYVNTVFGNEFWTREPARYPSGYYGFSSRVRFHLFWGQSWEYAVPATKHTPLVKSVSLFYELSSCDLYVVSAFTNKYLKPHDYLRLSLGAKFRFY